MKSTLFISAALSAVIVLGGRATAWAQTATSTPAATPSLAEQLKAARQAVRNAPTDAKVHYQLAEVLHKFNRNREAAQEYLEATSLDPNMLVAYHELAQTCDDAQQLDEAASRLTKLKEEKPKELMIRVALSEVLEKQKNYLPAARALIDLTYENAIPPKYLPRVNARIHYLLTKSKEAQLAQKEVVPTDDELDVVPAPLPDSGLRKGLTASKIRESRDLKGMGHAPLLP